MLPCLHSLYSCQMVTDYTRVHTIHEVQAGLFSCFCFKISSCFINSCMGMLMLQLLTVELIHETELLKFPI